MRSEDAGNVVVAYGSLARLILDIPYLDRLVIAPTDHGFVLIKSNNTMHNTSVASQRVLDSQCVQIPDLDSGVAGAREEVLIAHREGPDGPIVADHVLALEARDAPQRRPQLIPNRRDAIHSL